MLAIDCACAGPRVQDLSVSTGLLLLAFSLKPRQGLERRQLRGWNARCGGKWIIASALGSRQQGLVPRTVGLCHPRECRRRLQLQRECRRESIADIRHDNCQDDIRFWEDKDREYKLLCAEMLAYIADDKAFRAAAASENPSRSSSSFFDIYTQVNAVRVLVGLLIDQLRGLDSLSVEFESVIVPAINSPRPPTTHSRGDVHSPWWQFWSEWGGEREAQEAREQAEKEQAEKEQAEKEYRYMMRSLRQILKELERLVEKANAVVRELEGLEGGGVREVLRMVAQDEKRRRAEQQRDMAGPWRWSGLVRRARMWMPLFFAVDEDAAVLEEEDTAETAYRACEMSLLERVKELSAKTASSFVYLDALLKSRRVWKRPN